MAEPLEQILAAARSRWMIGGEAALPDHPLTAGQTAAEASLLLLAVAGQHQRLCQPPQPPELSLRPELPPPALPLLPEALRPLARRLLAVKTADAGPVLARFLVARGCLLHPADWLPPADADLPEAYRPWQLWQARAEAAQPLSTATWLDHGKAARLAQFRALRRADPAAARALLEAHLAASPAEERVTLVEALAEGLGPEDLAFLTSLNADRSERVQRAAGHLRTRLGADDDSPLAREVAPLFALSTQGLIRRRKVLTLAPKAREVQLRSLSQALPRLSLSALATALDLSPLQFAQSWDPETTPPHILEALAGMVARSAGDTELAAWWQSHLTRDDAAFLVLPALYPRLSVPDREQALLRLISREGIEAANLVLTLAGVELPLPISAALTARRHELADIIATARDTTPEKLAAARLSAARLATLLNSLGLLLAVADAALLLQTVTAAGLHPADPQLDALTLNAALPAVPKGS